MLPGKSSEIPETYSYLPHDKRKEAQLAKEKRGTPPGKMFWFISSQGKIWRIRRILHKPHFSSLFQYPAMKMH